MYLLMTPLGASEYYGSNNNADVFFEEALYPKEKGATWGYKTFETTPARLFRFHDNKDPEKAIGVVIKAAYNKDMHRVEVVAKLDKRKAPDIAEKINRMEDKLKKGQPLKEEDRLGISMGTRLLDGDICSLCGNRAFTKAEHCEHITLHAGEIGPDGKKIVMINPHPVFFDISFVANPAAKESGILRKIASILGSENNFATFPEVKTYISSEDEELQKAKEKFRKIAESESELDIDLIKDLTKLDPITVFDTLGSLGIILLPQEFQYYSLTKTGNSKVADLYRKNGVIFPEVSSATKIQKPLRTFDKLDYNEKLAQVIAPYMSFRSEFDSFLPIKKMEKISNQFKKPLQVLENPLLLEISKLYNGYREYLLDNITQTKIAELTIEKPDVLRYYLSSEAPLAKLAAMEIKSPLDISRGLVGNLFQLYLILS